MRIGNILKNNRRKLFEYFGSLKYSQLGIDLTEYLPEKGFFVEAGACDGLFQSNTYYLEKTGWTGILIEPVWEQYVKCTVNRANCELHCCLLGAKNKKGRIHFAGAMSVCDGSYLNTPKQIFDGIKVQHLPSSYTEETQVKTLKEIIGNRHVDFLSLDVEGYELDVLKGAKGCDIDWILVETDYPEKVAEILTNYRPVKKITFHDYLFKKY